MNPSFVRAMLGGVVGTLVFSLMLTFLAPIMLGHPMNIPVMVAHILGRTSDSRLANPCISGRGGVSDSL
jgi:hypothetical protein